MKTFTNPNNGLIAMIEQIDGKIVVRTNSITEPRVFSSPENIGITFNTMEWAEAIARKLVFGPDRVAEMQQDEETRRIEHEVIVADLRAEIERLNNEKATMLALVQDCGRVINGELSRLKAYKKLLVIALADALATFREDDKTTLITAERQEAWKAALAEATGPRDPAP